MAHRAVVGGAAAVAGGIVAYQMYKTSQEEQACAAEAGAEAEKLRENLERYKKATPKEQKEYSRRAQVISLGV